MEERRNGPTTELEQAARILGVSLDSACLRSVIADPENFRALFQTIHGNGKSPTPPDSDHR